MRSKSSSIRSVSHDFITMYADYADVLEAPHMMHEWVALTAIAALLNKNGIRIPLGALTATLDLWVILLSGSGFGRSTLIRMIRPILEKAGISDLVHNSQWGSPQALYQQMAETPAGLFVWGELSEKLKLLGQPRFEGAKPWLTDRYDELQTPESIVYRKTDRESDTPSIDFKDAPRIDILATSSTDWFFKYLQPEDSLGGFIPRWNIVWVKGPRRVIAIPRTTDPALVTPLANHLKKIARLKGKAHVSKIREQYEQWYEAALRRFESQPNKDLAMAYFNRQRTQILKLAVIYEASASRTLIVSQDSWNRAERTCAELENTIFSLLTTGISARGYEISAMEDRIRQAESAGLPRSKFTRAFQHHDQRAQHLKTLYDSGMVHEFRRPTSGRTAKVLVHSDSLSAYKAQHSKEKEYEIRG